MILTRIRETIIKAQDFPVKLIVFIGVAIFMTVYFFPRFKNQIMHPNKSARLMDLQMALEQNEIADRGN